jgi:hypothetical protein
MYKSRERRSEAQLRVSEAFQPDLEVASDAQLVFGSPVRSGLLTPRAFNRDRNRSFYVGFPKKTGPNRCGPVHIGFLRLRNRLGPVKVQTSY